MPKMKFSKAWEYWQNNIFSPKNICPAIVFWSPTSTFDSHVTKIFIIIGVAVAALLLMVALKRRKQVEEPMFTALDDAAFIDSVVLRAAELQVRFDLICTRSGLEHRHLQGYCRIPKKDTEDGCRQDHKPNIILELHAGSISTGWDGAPIDVYLQLSQNETCTLFHFASFVCKIHKKADFTLMEIIRPSILSNTKAKDTVRIEPLPEMIALTSLWFYHTTEPILPQRIADLGKVQAAYRPTGNSDFRIVSISASNIRLRFVRDVLIDAGHHIKVGHQICMLIAINTEQEKSGKLVLWVRGVCSGFAPCTDIECLDAVFSFTHWQQIRTRTEDIRWYPATDTDRVPPLMHWILHATARAEEEADEAAARRAACEKIDFKNLDL